LLTVINQNKFYFLLLGIYFITGAVLLLTFEKGDLELMFNRQHIPVLDFVFKYLTYLGDGFFAIPFILIILLFRKTYQAIIMTASLLATFAIIQLLKTFIFYDHHRPSKFFTEAHEIYYVEGVDIHSLHSFPSGHSAQAFCIFLLCALFIRNKNWSFVFFTLALGVTLSRIYLMQHFFIDTYFGALIAVIVTFGIYVWVENYTSLKNRTKLQKGLIF
jgi:membrane-associated phospholipid phosphatase